MTTAILCPYCSIRSCDSDDHAFPQFLGGRVTVRACKTCNDTFGYTFEADISERLKAVTLMLRLSGMRPPIPTVWKNVLFDDGNTYNLNEDLVGHPSRPVVTKNDNNHYTAMGGKSHIMKIFNSMKKKGYVIGSETVTTPKVDASNFTMMFNIDRNMRRLALKMSIAAAFQFGNRVGVNHHAVDYLLGIYSSSGSDRAPVQIDMSRYEALDGMRPRAGHLVYVESSSASGRCYSVVQMFSVFQLYCDLGPSCGDFSISATHDPVTHEEHFIQVAPISIPAPPLHVDSVVFQEQLKSRTNRLREELVSRYGEDKVWKFN